MQSVAVLAFASVLTAAPSLGQSCFEIEPAVPVGLAPVSVAFADLDGDGDLDLGTVDALARTVTLLWNTGDGTWGAPQTLATDFNPSHLDFADVDGDGDADLAYAHTSGVHTLAVRRNLGGQIFGAPETYPVPAYPAHFVFADVDDDLDLDVAVASSGAGTGGTSVGVILRNSGSGTFSLGGALITAPMRVEAADFDLDGDVDFAMLRDDSATVFVLRNGGSGSFTFPPTSIVLSAATRDLAAGDFNGDGRPDLAVVQAGNRFSILIGTAGGGFAPYVEVPIPQDASRIAAGDFDADGDLDLATTNWAGSATTVFVNAGNGVFALDAAFATGGGNDLDAGDVDGDGDLDLAIALTGSAVRVLRNCVVSGTPTCFGDGSGTACPCGNASAVGARAGCLHSLGVGGTLRASGAVSLAADSVVLLGASMPNSPSMYFQGTSAIGAGLGSVFGDGLRCAGGSVMRLGITANSGGASQFPEVGQPALSVAGAVTSPGERHYQVWYRNAASFCTPSAFNLTNSLRLAWRP